MTLNSLQKLIADFNACESITPIRDHFTAPLSRIMKALSTPPRPEDGFNNYLKFKQIEKDILDIQQFVALKNSQIEVQTLYTSKEFQALESSKVFLLAQQQEWYPHYLAKEIQNVLSSDRDKNTDAAKQLSEAIKQIANNSAMNGKEKTEHITNTVNNFIKNNTLNLLVGQIKQIASNSNMNRKEKTGHITIALVTFTKTNKLTIFADKAKPLKMALQDTLDAQRETNINRLFEPSTQAKKAI